MQKKKKKLLPQMIQTVLYPLTSFRLYFPGTFCANALWACWGWVVGFVYIAFKMNCVQNFSFQLYMSTGQD